eukprot:gene18683-22308_t
MRPIQCVKKNKSVPYIASTSFILKTYSLLGYAVVLNNEPAMRLWDRSKASSPSRSQERSPKADDVSSSVEQQAMEIAIRRGGLANVKLRDASDLVAQLEEMQQEELAASPSERAYSDTFATSPTMDPRSAAKSDAPSPSHAHVNAVEAVPAPAGMSTQLLVQEPVPETLSAQPTTGSPLGALPPLAAPKGEIPEYSLQVTYAAPSM